MVQIESPEYKGDERRKTLVLSHCVCHPKHEKVLSDHAEMIKEMRSERNELSRKQDGQHRLMWDDIKTIDHSKVEKRLFYIFVAITVGILGFVYNGIHQVDKAVAVLNTNVELHFDQAKEIKVAIDRVDKKVNDHIFQTRHQMNGPTKP